MDIVVTVAIVAALFLLAGLAEPVAARLRLPFSVILAGIGILIGAGAAWFLATDLTDALNPVAIVILEFPITSEIFLYGFLPTLLFQATIGMNVRRMADDWVPILVLAIVAVVLATLSVGYALSLTAGLPLMACLLLGAIISTTDPSAVVSIFRSIAAPQRLARIVEGESLLNDAAAIALFGIFIGFVMRGVPDPDLVTALLDFPLILAGGAVTGWVLARLTGLLLALLAPFATAQITATVALPYLAFIIAEQIVGASGVIATVTAGLTMSIVGPGRLTPSVWTQLRDTWDLLAHWSGAFIFVLAAILIPRLLSTLGAYEIGLLGIVILATTLSRIAVLWGLLPTLALLRLSPPVENTYRAAILWGGLRGAVTLALALSVTENALVAPEIRRLVGVLATGFVLFTLVAQGTTLRLVIARLGLDRLSPIDAALANQVVATALQSVREEVATATENYGLNRETVRAEAKAFGERLDTAVRAADESEALLDRDRVTLGLIALAGFEREMILDRFRDRAISGRLAEIALSDADRLIEMTRTDGRTGYRRAARAELGQGGAYGLAIRFHNRLRLSGPLQRMTADRFELMLMQRLIVKDLHRFIDSRIRRIHGRRVADLLHDLLERRGEEIDQALEGLRLQYPGYAEELERRFIRRAALRIEEREYESLHDDGLIGDELHATLKADIAARRGRAEQRPKLDLAVQKADLVRQFPVFADLTDRDRTRLARALVTRMVSAGEVLLTKSETPSSVYFIASGAVEIDMGPSRLRLGRGEMFGQLAVLSRRVRRGEIRAISHGVLLVLDEARFRRLLQRSKSLREAVRDSAIKRGLAPEAIDALIARPALTPPSPRR